MVPSQARRMAKYQVDPSPNGEAVAVGPRSNSPPARLAALLAPI